MKKGDRVFYISKSFQVKSTKIKVSPGTDTLYIVRDDGSRAILPDSNKSVSPGNIYFDERAANIKCIVMAEEKIIKPCADRIKELDSDLFKKIRKQFS